MRTTRDLGGSLDELAAALEALEMGTSQRDLLAERDRLVTTVRGYLRPRVDDPSGPLTVVFAGPTGSGKSTLINSVVGSKVTDSGALRPTTCAPLAIAPPERALDYASIGGVECDVVVRRAPILDRLVLVDTPDIDSTETEHRARAETLIDSADVVVFVTSALRYADAVPWQVLRRAVARGTDVIQVLNRVGSSTKGAAVDFRSRLRRERMDETILTVPEYHLTPDNQGLPLVAVRDLRQRLVDVALDQGDDAESVFDRVLRATVHQLEDFVDKLEDTRKMRAEFEAGVVTGLSDRLGGLSLAGSAEGIYEPVPAQASGRRLRRWRKSSRLEEAGVDAQLGRIIGEMTARVESDLRGWMADERPQLDAGRLFGVDSLRPLIVEAVHGWTEYVRRIGEAAGERDQWLSMISLFDAATRGETTASVRALHGDQASVLVDRAQRELRNRLEVVYEQAASRFTDSVLGVPRELDEADVREALGAVAEVASPAYA